MSQRLFRVLLKGSNFVLPWEDGLRHLGFFVTRFVEARDEEEAVEAAIAIVRSDSRFTLLANDVRDPPRVAVEEITELPCRSVGARLREPGFAFFEEGSIH